jgi:hypothetical protein
LAGKHKRKKPLGKHSCRGKDNVKMRLKEMGWEGVDYIHLGHDRDQLPALVNKVTNSGVSSNSESFLSGLSDIGLSSRR